MRILRRWLGVEEPSYDRAYVQVSNDGTNWTTIWENTSAVNDTGWVAQSFDISGIAGKEPAVQVRWGMGPTDKTPRPSSGTKGKSPLMPRRTPVGSLQVPKAAV